MNRSRIYIQIHFPDPLANTGSKRASAPRDTFKGRQTAEKKVKTPKKEVKSDIKWKLT